MTTLETIKSILILYEGAIQVLFQNPVDSKMVLQARDVTANLIYDSIIDNVNAREYYRMHRGDVKLRLSNMRGEAVVNAIESASTNPFVTAEELEDLFALANEELVSMIEYDELMEQRRAYEEAADSDD